MQKSTRTIVINTLVILATIGVAIGVSIHNRNKKKTAKVMGGKENPDVAKAIASGDIPMPPKEGWIWNGSGWYAPPV